MLNIVIVTVTIIVLVYAVISEGKHDIPADGMGYIARYPNIDETFAGKDFGTEDFNCHTAGTIIDEAFYDGMKKPVDLPVDFIFPILRENEAYAKEVPDFDGFFDEIGGFHSGGTGTDPEGHECGECSRVTCKGCAVWEKH